MAGIFVNYVVLGGVVLVLSKFFIHDASLWTGFVILAAVPPAVAVIPLTFFLMCRNLSGKISDALRFFLDYLLKNTPFPG
jgi:hypothetical protein